MALAFSCSAHADAPPEPTREYVALMVANYCEAPDGEVYRQSLRFARNAYPHTWTLLPTELRHKAEDVLERGRAAC